MSILRRDLRAGALLALAAALAGCRHQPAAPLPVQAQAPAAAPAGAPSTPITVVTPLPSIPPDTEPRKVQPAEPEPPPPAPAAETQKTRKRFRKSKPAIAAGAPPAPVQSASAPKESAGALATTAGEPAASPASVDGVVPSPPGTPGQSYNSTVVEEAAPSLGHLSTGPQESQPARIKMLAETQSLEERLTKLKQPANHEGAAVRLQVQVFLKRAREAAEESDLDGAQTLNTKARVLLGELETE